MDETGDSFTPQTIKFVAAGSKYEVVNRFLEYTNLGAYQFPSRIEWTMTSYPPTTPPTVLSTGTVAVISARIPDQIADSVFKLDSEEKSAAVVWDWDQQKLIKSAPELAKVEVKYRVAKTILLLLMLFSIVVVPILVGKKFASKNN